MDCIHGNFLVLIYIVVLQNVAIGGKWLKCTWDPSMLFLTIACESKIISIKIQIKKNSLMELLLQFSWCKGIEIGHESKKIYYSYVANK